MHDFSIKENYTLFDTESCKQTEREKSSIDSTISTVTEKPLTFVTLIYSFTLNAEGAIDEGLCSVVLAEKQGPHNKVKLITEFFPESVAMIKAWEFANELLLPVDLLYFHPVVTQAIKG